MIPQHPALLPPPPQADPPRRSEGLLVIVATILGAVVVLGGLVGFQWLGDRQDDVAATAGQEQADGDEQAAGETGAVPSTDTPSADPSSEESAPSAETEADPDNGESSEDSPDLETPGPVQSVPCPDRYSDEICSAADFVQQARGRPFREFPTIELLDDASFDEALVQDLDESRDELLEDERPLKALGLLPADIDLFETYQSLIESGVVGFYDPDDGRLVVRGGEFDLYGQAILVHELVHAFDDQWFDLSRDDFDNDDAEYGYAAVIEGNASRVEDLWREQLSVGDRARLTQQEFSSLSPEDLQRLLSLPQILLNLQLSPYEDGERYVSQLAAAGGEQAVDDKFVNPPESSEEVLHPSLSAGDLAIAEVERPPADGPELSSGRLGELLIDLWLGQQAGDGWGGDSFVVWESDGETCATVDVAGDTSEDLGQIEQAAESWAANRSDFRSVEAIDGADRSVIRIIGCY